MWKCEFCEKENKDDARFCMYCGNRRPAEVQTEMTGETAENSMREMTGETAENSVREMTGGAAENSVRGIPGEMVESSVRGMPGEMPELSEDISPLSIEGTEEMPEQASQQYQYRYYQQQPGQQQEYRQSGQQQYYSPQTEQPQPTEGPQQYLPPQEDQLQPQSEKVVKTTGLIVWSAIVAILLSRVCGIVAFVLTLTIKATDPPEKQIRQKKNAKIWCIVGTAIGCVILIISFAVGLNSAKREVTQKETTSTYESALEGIEEEVEDADTSELQSAAESAQKDEDSKKVDDNSGLTGFSTSNDKSEKDDAQSTEGDDQEAAGEEQDAKEDNSGLGAFTVGEAKKDPKQFWLGDWAVSGAIVDGTEYTIEQLEEITGEDLQTDISFWENGIYFGEDNDSFYTGEWVMDDDNTITMDPDGEVPITAVRDGERITMNSEGVTLIFTKE